MPIRLPSLRGVIKWPHTATVVIATSGLVIALFAVTRRIWRGGGKKAKDPDGTVSCKKSREKIDKEKTRSDSKEPPVISKGKEFLEEKEEPPKQIILVKEATVTVTIEDKPHALTKKPSQLAELAEETKETVTNNFTSSELTGNPQSQPKSAEETKTKVAVHNKPVALKENPQAQAIVSEDNNTKGAAQNKFGTLIESLEPQPKVTKETKIKVPIQEKPIVVEEELLAQNKVAAAVENKVTTQIKPDHKEVPQPNKVQKIDLEVRPLNKEVNIKVENSNHPLSNVILDRTPKNEAGEIAKPLNGVSQVLTLLEKTAKDSVSETNQESTSLLKTNKTQSPIDRSERPIFFADKNRVGSLPEAVKSTSENLKLEGTSQSVGTRDINSDLNDSAEPVKEEVVSVCEQTNLIPQSKESVLKLSLGSTQIAGTEVISGTTTVGKLLKTESEASNHFDGVGKKLESISVSTPRIKHSLELVKLEDTVLEKVQKVQSKSTDNCGGVDKLSNSISPSTVEENVKEVNSVISASSEPLTVQVKSLDGLDNSKELKHYSASLETVDEPVKVVNLVDIELVKPSEVQLCESNCIDDTDNQLIEDNTLSLKTEQTKEKVNSVISGVGKLQINQLKPSNNLEGDDKQLRSTSTAEKSVEVVNSLESQSGQIQNILFNSSGHLEGADRHLKDISVSPSSTEKSLVVVSEEGKDVESKQVSATSAFPEDCGETACQEGVLPKEKEGSDIEVREKVEVAEGEEEDSLCQRSTVSEVALVADTAEPAALGETTAELCMVESGSSALGDQAEVVTVQPSSIVGAGLTEKEVEVCPVSKDLSETLVNENNKVDSTLHDKGEEVELIDKEVASSPSEKGNMLTKGAEPKSDLVKGKSGSGKRKGKKGKSTLDEEVEKMVEKMEVKDMVRESEESILQSGDVGEDQSGKSIQVHASGISSPSMPNFPDNRSEGSSCGDSGKGRSDVTTPGGLEEDLREVSFSHHFSPPCSTSGPEEEEEEDRVRRDSGSTADDGSRGEIRSAIEGEEIVGDPAIVVGSDGLVVPVPVPIYHGMVPITPLPSVYEFVIPQGLVGRLIGKHGAFVNLIKTRTSTTIFIKTHPETNKLKVCAIEGTEDEIQAALDMIREKFPLRRYSSMTLEQVFFLPLPPPTFTLIPDSLPLQLVEGVSNDVILSALMSPSHYFLQQPTHPTYPTLAKLDMWMAMSYQDANAPMLPEDVKAGIICAAPTMGGWYRAQIVAVEELPSTPEDESVEEGELIKWCDVRFVDYGGYERLPSHSLRQIRSDFMTLPFQASECYLASVIPAPTSDENKMAEGWSMEAYALVEELTQAQVLKAQVVGHATDGLPLVLLYAFSHSYGQVVQVNNELVNRGLAVWAVPVVDADQILLASGGEDISGDDNPPEEQPEIAVA